MLLLLALLQSPDTLRVLPASVAPVFDGVVGTEEYPDPPTLTLARPGGVARVWLRRIEGRVYLAATITDSTWYWGDDLVISLCTAGDRAAGPEHDDFQWYFRRLLDSSVVLRGEAGKWRMPRDDPDWRLGTAREGGGWEVRSANAPGGWSLEFRLDSAWFTQSREARPAMALRIYDDAPHGWTAWPSPSGIRQSTEVERRPALWVPVILP